ncbi:uncharacterized protein LOC122025027 [Zingiber officinale]|uniref:uncharacterized protein LOC122025027 n=1 Tax=Zingiber officinale TaxID=94328 RepID=UPI001C4D0DBA|nr:uncharacterized protein LOC122025027 [Zingiber officinale]
MPAAMAGGGASGDADGPSEISSSSSSFLALICSRPWLYVSGLMDLCEVHCSIYCSPNPVESRLFWSSYRWKSGDQLLAQYFSTFYTVIYAKHGESLASPSDGLVDLVSSIIVTNNLAWFS